MITRLKQAGRTEQALQYADRDTMHTVRADCLVTLARKHWLNKCKLGKAQPWEEGVKSRTVEYLTEALQLLIRYVCIFTAIAFLSH